MLGSGIGTTVGRSVGVAIQIWMLTGGKSRMVVRGRHFHFSAESMWKLIQLSIGGIFQYFVGMASWIGMVRMVSTFRQHRDRGLHDRDARVYFRDPAELGHGERRGYISRPESWRGSSGSRRASGEAGGAVQHGVPRLDRRDLRNFRGSAGVDFHG